MSAMSVETANSSTRYSKSSRQSAVALWVSVGLFAIGLLSLIYALRSAAARLDLPLLTVSFLYLMGVSQAGIVFCAMTRLMRARWARPYYRLAELATMAFCPFAIALFLAIYAYGRDELFHWLGHGMEPHANPWLSSEWLLIRNLLGLVLFYVISAIYVAKSIRPDQQAGQTDLVALERQLYLLSPWVIVAFVVCNTFLAWDFGMSLIPHWHSTVFPIHYWFGSVFAGTAALIVFPALLGKSHEVASLFGPEQIRSLGMLLTAFTLMWLYFFWAQFFVIWFGNMPREFEPLWRQMYGHYAPYFWAMLVGCFFLPFAAFIFAVVKRSLAAMCLIAIGINVGIWINKYLIVVPALVPDDRPFDAWLDVTVALGVAAGFVAMVMLLAGRFFHYASWELALRPEANR